MLDRIAIITGSSSGIGQSFVRHYLNNKYSVIGIDIQSTNDDIVAQSEEFRYTYCDLADVNSYEILDDIILGLTNKNITMVNCAGIAFIARISESKLINNISTLLVNCYAPLYTTTRLTEIYSKNRRITIINVSSTVAFSPIPLMAVYGASKAFLHSLSLAMQHENRDERFDIFELIPGGTESNFQKSAGVKTKNDNLLSPDRVVEDCIKAINRGKKHLVVGIKNKILVMVMSVIPTSMKMKIWTNLISQ